MKTFFRVDSLDEVGVALGFARGTSSAWSNKQRFTNSALFRYYELRAKGAPPPKQESHAEFKQLVREMKEFFEVGSLKAVAQKLGLLPTACTTWHKTKKLPDSVVEKFNQLRAEKQAQNPQKQGLFPALQSENHPPPPVSSGKRLKCASPEEVHTRAEQIAELLHETRRTHGFKNWEQMGVAMDTPAGTLRAYSSGKAQGLPSLKFLRKLAKLADVSGVLGGQVLEGLPPAERKKEQGNVLFKVYDNLNTLLPQDTDKTPMLSLDLRARYPYNALKLLGVHQNEMLVVCLKNDSMSPLLEAGDYLLIERNAEVSNGEVVVFEYGGEVFVKNMHKNPVTGGAKFSSKNKDYPDFEIAQGDEKFKMIGVVRGKIKLF
ncbi:S24 family peptidase [Helicobacter salomonis]|uniref:S24 family peptidase n=1 Tax=Helicobacter salomonis TaxID=56878 RepID=UPI0013157952|nr:S24 family peptidase [Helicobacter salomonis]